MGIEDQNKQAQEEATKARNEFKAKMNKLALRVLIISLICTTIIWYFGWVM